MLRSIKDALIIWLALMTFVTISNAQLWTGDGDGVSWGDSDNWNNNAVPTSSQTASISNASVVFSDQNIVQRVLLNNATLTISSNSGLTVRGSMFDGINLINSTVIVNGILSVRDFGLIGINALTGSELIVGTTGILRIRDGSGSGIDNTGGQVINNGSIEIENTQRGIRTVGGGLTNKSNILIEDMSDSGIDHRQGGFQNIDNGQIEIVGDTATNVVGVRINGFLENEGVLRIKSCYAGAVRIEQDTFINADSLIITDYQFGILAQVATNFIANESTGVILCEDAIDDGPAFMLSSQGGVENYGMLRSEGFTFVGISLTGGTGVFDNFGIIENENTFSQNYIGNSSTFHNHINGEISIESDLANRSGILNSKTFINEGLISINLPSTSEVGISSDSFSDTALFQNSGTITILGGETGILTKFFVTDTDGTSHFINESNGSISISDCKVGVDMGGIFVNENSILIEDVTEYGIKVNENSSFTNGVNAHFNLNSTIPMRVDSSGVVDIKGEFILSTPN